MAQVPVEVRIVRVRMPDMDIMVAKLVAMAPDGPHERIIGSVETKFYVQEGIADAFSAFATKAADAALKAIGMIPSDDFRPVALNPNTN